jgi:DNA topoisomerase-1
VTLLEQLQARGIRRRGTPRTGFRYVSADGRPLKPRALARVKALKIPPAWTDVYIHPSPRAHLQAVGKDRAGRWQYRYHPAFRQRQEARKYDRLVDFAQALPAMRRTVDAHLRDKGLGRERVMAGILKILSTCFIRPGSQVYADENGSFGLATLRPRHVSVKGDTVHFDFRGKSGTPQHRSMTDRRVARLVRELLAVPGKEVFKFIDDDGRVVDVRRRDINAYIKEVMGEHFTAKDFRTWAGTLVAACALARAAAAPEPAPTAAARRRKVASAVKEAAALLGNTPAICRASYVYPSVLSSFERGRVVDRYFDRVEELVTYRGPGLHPSEKALLALLRDQARAERARSRPRT